MNIEYATATTKLLPVVPGICMHWIAQGSPIDGQNGISNKLLSVKEIL